MSVDYVTIKVPKEFANENITPILNLKKLGFTSNADVVKQAVREFFEKCMKEGQ